LRLVSVYMLMSFVMRRGVEPLAVGHRVTTGLREPLAITHQKRKKPPRSLPGRPGGTGFPSYLSRPDYPPGSRASWSGRRRANTSDHSR